MPLTLVWTMELQSILSLTVNIVQTLVCNSAKTVMVWSKENRALVLDRDLIAREILYHSNPMPI